MHFGNPNALHLLWLLPVLAAALHFAHARKQAKAERFIAAGLLPPEIRRRDLFRARLQAAFLLAAFTLSAIALARPQWGYEWQEVKHQGLDILIAIDVSKSMLTEDVKPNRLERTKLAIKDLVKKLNGDRVGLIAFAGDAFLTCPLTVDYNGFLLSLDDVGIDTIPRGGTNFSSAIEEAEKAYGNKGQPHKVVVLVTDGEDNEGDALKSARAAQAKGIRIFTVGVGTQEGDLIKTAGNQGEESFLKDAQGNYVKSRLNENLLQQIAYATGGAYVRSSGAQFGLDYIYEQQLSNIEKHDFDTKMEKKYFDRYQWLVALVLVFLVLENMVTVWKTE